MIVLPCLISPPISVILGSGPTVSLFGESWQLTPCTEPRFFHSSCGTWPLAPPPWCLQSPPCYCTCLQPCSHHLHPRIPTPFPFLFPFLFPFPFPLQVPFPFTCCSCPLSVNRVFPLPFPLRLALSCSQGPLLCVQPVWHSSRPDILLPQADMSQCCLPQIQALCSCRSGTHPGRNPEPPFPWGRGQGIPHRCSVQGFGGQAPVRGLVWLPSP